MVSVEVAGYVAIALLCIGFFALLMIVIYTRKDD